MIFANDDPFISKKVEMSNINSAPAVILLPTDSATASSLQIQITAGINYFFLSVYMAEVVIKVMLLGPYLYSSTHTYTSMDYLILQAKKYLYEDEYLFLLDQYPKPSR